VPPASGFARPGPGDRLSSNEARRIASAIRPRLWEYADRYDEKKYWPHIYTLIRREFRDSADVSRGAIRKALLWKWGHLGKRRIPAAHTALIADIQGGWSKVAATLPSSHSGAFDVLDSSFGPNRFVTVAFMLHLLRPRSVPIVDQHNFRAVNDLIRQVRPEWRPRAAPCRYRDLETVTMFMETVLKAWRQSMPVSAPSSRTFDKFLMMYGKAIKHHRVPAGQSCE
jgi:hypothetical protein